ncbi:uncharacterized protein UBRO_20856 [Ustilago bromivora]|uniref:Integrase catalytic domain-containing protein n=1 Tax=Ustilago bromivora TaxID=307758 RepID=A0A1K0GVM9_9BASI|nr:uncharacterized protein UBRO_20856 [Ustilago bromivora]
MDVMGPLHGDIKFVYMLIIHDAYSGMTWAQGLASKGEVSQEAAWWFSEMCVAMHQKPSEIVIDHGIREIHIDQGELWSHHLPRSLLIDGHEDNRFVNSTSYRQCLCRMSHTDHSEDRSKLTLRLEHGQMLVAPRYCASGIQS